MVLIAIHKAFTIPQRTFGIIPVLFAFQQFVEGLMWLVLLNPQYDYWSPLLTHTYLLFAWIIWPLFIPFALGLLVNMASYLFTKIFFQWHLVSIWCFFGALSSIIVLLIIIGLKKMQEKEEYKPVK